MSQQIRLEDKLSEGLKDILRDKPSDYTLAVVIEPSSDKVSEYIEIKTTYSKEAIRDFKEFENKAKKIFAPIYDFFEANGIQYALLFADAKLTAKLTKDLIYELTSYSFVKRILEPRLEPL